MSIKNNFFTKHPKYINAMIVAGLSIVFGFFIVVLSIFSRILLGENELLSFVFIALGVCSLLVGLLSLIYMIIYFISRVLMGWAAARKP